MKTQLCSMRKNGFRLISAVALMTVLSGWQTAHAQNLLSNSDFDMVGPLGPDVTYTTVVPGWAGWSAAENWSMFTNTPGTITTQLLPGDAPGQGRMIRVVTDGNWNGIAQVFGDIDTGPETAFSCAWIFVVSGQVGINAGNGGNMGDFGMLLRKTGSWECVPVSNEISPVNEFVIYSVGGGAEFFVESAQVSTKRRFCLPK